MTLLENSLLGDKAPGLRGVEKPEIKAKFNAEVAVNLNVNNQEGRKRLTALLEKVEGCAVSDCTIKYYLCFFYKYFENN